MGFLWRWVERLKRLVTPGRHDAETMDEIRFHVDMEIREGMARGLSAKEARRKALRDFGGVERYREQAREMRWASWFHDIRRDVKVGLTLARAASRIHLRRGVHAGAGRRRDDRLLHSR